MLYYFKNKYTTRNFMYVEEVTIVQRAGKSIKGDEVRFSALNLLSHINVLISFLFFGDYF